EDGIRDLIVTGVQTCALPISVGFTCAGCGGSGAAATANIANQYVITGLNLTNPGSGYATNPTVTITPNPPAGPGSGATGTATVRSEERRVGKGRRRRRATGQV